jgi:hypothetical protein
MEAPGSASNAYALSAGVVSLPDMIPYSRYPIKFVDAGLYLRPTTTLVPPGKFRALTNLYSEREGELRPRYGTVKFNAAPLAVAGVHSLGYLNDPVLNKTLLLAGAGTYLFDATAGGASIDSGYSGNGLTFVYYRLNASSSPYAIIGDSSQMRKIDSSGTARKLGITPPSVAAISAVAPLQSQSIETFDADAGFAYANVASHSSVTGEVGNALQVVTNSGVTATVSKVAAVDLSTINGLSASDSDYFHIWINIDDPLNISELRILFDVDAASVSGGAFTATAFTQNYYVASLTPSPAQRAFGGPMGGALGGLSGFDAVRAAMLQTQQIRSGTFGIAPILDVPINFSEFEGITSIDLATGKNQWAEYKVLRSAFTRVGTDTSRTWANVQGFQIMAITTPAKAATLILDDLYIFGGVGPDSNLGVNYDWRYTYYNAAANADSNPSPVQAGTLTVTRQPVDLTPVPSTDGQVTHISWWRRGGTLGDNWRFLGRQNNLAAIPITSITRATNVVTATVSSTSGMAVGNRIEVSGVTDASFNGNFTLTSVTATTLVWSQNAANASSAGGTVLLIFQDGHVDADIANLTQLSITNDVPVTSVNSAGATVLEVPLPSIWGPYNGTTIFGCGDPNRPGYLYWSNPSNPDGWSSINNVEVTQPSEPLVNGFIWNDRVWVFSAENLYEVIPNPVGSVGAFVALPTAAGRGLFAPLCFAAGPDTPAIWFLAKDGIFETQGGPAVSVTEDDIYPLFHGIAAEGYQPVDFTQKSKLRMAYFDLELWFQYQDTAGNMQLLIWHTVKRRWRHASFAFSPLTVFPRPETNLALFFGGSDANVYLQDRTQSTDNGTPISFLLRTGALDFGDYKIEKEFGQIDIEMDAKLASIGVKVLYDDDSQQVVLPNQTGNGRMAFPITLGDFYAKTMSLELSSTTSVAPILYGFDTRWRPDQIPVVHWESPESSFGMPGYGHIYDGYVALRSSSVVRLTLIADQFTLGPYPIDSTSGARIKAYVQVDPNKFKLARLMLDSDQPFRVYPEDSFLNVSPWGGSGYFQAPLGA